MPAAPHIQLLDTVALVRDLPELGLVAEHHPNDGRAVGGRQRLAQRVVEIGHAVAKGAFLLLSADYRIGVEGAFNIGLNEVKIGMTMHHVGITLARDRLSPAAFQRSVINAEMFSPQGALTAGFLDQVVPADQLMAAANAMAQQLKGLNMAAHQKTKLKVRKALLDALDAAIDDAIRRRVPGAGFHFFSWDAEWTFGIGNDVNTDRTGETAGSPKTMSAKHQRRWSSYS